MRRWLAPLAVLLALSGCGLGAGDSASGVSVVVTRDFGAKVIGEARNVETGGEETVMRLLQRSFDVRTRYGGGFVQAIDGLSGGREDGRPVDWFFYVNGVESDEGAASVDVRDGDTVWWDRHDWGEAMRIPAVVGAFPEPFRNGIEGKRIPVRIDCAEDSERACDEVQDRLAAGGVPTAAKASLGTETHDDTLRLLVGPWRAVRADPAGRRLADGPKASGVFARFSDDGRTLHALDARGREARSLGPGTGLIAATVYEQQVPTWIVSGTDEAGVLAAAQALEEGVLGRRFALAIAGGRGVGLPVMGG